MPYLDDTITTYGDDTGPKLTSLGSAPRLPRPEDSEVLKANSVHGPISDEGKALI